jgi:hypothetical protein
MARKFCPGGKAAPYPLLVRRLRMSAAIPLLLLYTFMLWTGALYRYIRIYVKKTFLFLISRIMTQYIFHLKNCH